VSEYGDQAEIAAQARTKLAAWPETAPGPQNLGFEQGEPGTVPPGWFVPTPGWTSELSRGGCRSARGCATLGAPVGPPTARFRFGNLMQTFSAAAYRGKTVRLHAWLRVDGDGPEDRTQMWLRVDRPNRQVGFFDNMQNRPVHSSKWTSCEIVGKVAPDADKLNFGVIVYGNGRAWIDDVTFEVVAKGKVKETAVAPVKSALLDFGVATATFPVGAAAGRHVRFSGYIRTVDIKDGYAGLWWRVDGPQRANGRPTFLGFDNMRDRGPRGTTDWQLYEISLLVPPEATNINFGVLHPGKGTAWFDGLAIELDGVPYLDNSGFDLSFGSMPVRGFYTGGNGYRVDLDTEVFHTSGHSLRVQYAGTGK
jgi:hypothetical protein